MQTLTIYYDGYCPLCQAEIRFLQSRNSANLLRFVDLREPHFNESAQHVSCKQALATIHGRLGDGEFLTGVRVFAEAYRRVGLNAVARLLSHAVRGKAGLPSKPCPHCGRPFAWRKKWAREWGHVKYCSDRCRRATKGPL